MNTSPVCPVCELGLLHAETYSDEFQHNGKASLVTGLERYRCDRCASDPVLTDQIRRNQLRICDQKRRSDGYLTGAEIKAIRERLRLSQSQAATLFGGGPNAFSKYERGEVIQGLSMDRLIRSAAHFPPVLHFLRSLTTGPSQKPVVPDTYTSTTEPEPSLNDPLYTSKPIPGSKVLVSRRDVSYKVISLPRKRVA